MAANEGNDQDAEQAVAQLRYLQNIYSQQYEMIESEIATYSLALSAINKNIDMLEDPDKINNKEMLLNGEGGTYIVAKIKPVEQVITYVGAGYLVEKSLEDAKAFLNDNRKKQEENLRRLSEERLKIEKELVSISYKLSAYNQQQV